MAVKPLRIQRGFEVKAALPIRALEQMYISATDHEHGAVYVRGRDHNAYFFVDHRDVARILFASWSDRATVRWAHRAMCVSIAVRQSLVPLPTKGVA